MLLKNVAETVQPVPGFPGSNLRELIFMMLPAEDRHGSYSAIKLNLTLVRDGSLVPQIETFESLGIAAATKSFTVRLPSSFILSYLQKLSTQFFGSAGDVAFLVAASVESQRRKVSVCNADRVLANHKCRMFISLNR